LSVIESTIDGRYQVISRIAAGGMGEVYRAHDAVLGREVAIKVLHPHLAGDRGFVDRFRQEARAAAILNHTSIVGVYDWGVTEGTYFMVMEFLRGLNLRTLLAQYGKLEPAQVVEVALPVLAALDHAHGHGIVHRDVKPENILIAQDGTVKVADFGLARAYAESYVSQAEGTVTGTVQYLAPEQIQGEPADPRTDLYAFGIVMFEMLTGRPPFAGETSLAIAYQHLSGRVPVPSSIEPSVPATLDRVVVRATEKDRADRPASAKAMRDEIALAGVGLPPAPRIAELAGQIPGVELVPEDRATTVTIPRAVSPRARRRRRFRLVAGLIALVALLLVGAWATWVYAIPHYTNVPSVQGLTTRQAVVRLEQAGLRPVTADGVFSTSIPSGHVLRVTPKDGSRIRKGSSVTLVPSLGPELVPVTDVRGQTLAQARTALQQEGFEVRVVRRADDQIPKDQVIDQNPQAPVKLEKGATVTLTVSNGPPLVEVPDVTGQSAADATATLENFAFTVATLEDFSTEVPKGDVISTDPPAHAKAKKGSEVTIVVSKGPKTFAMPDVTGKTKEAAMAQLEGLGLNVHVFTLPNTQGDVVVFQDPDPGTIVKQGDTVTIYVTAT
jgi:beta-lactam-binding protein with PASTA domain/predicted Ser/Thr protein kinase